jgi:hypothetical protein
MSDHDPTFGHVCNLEKPLGAIRRLADALVMMTETVEEPHGSAMNEIVHTLLGHVGDLDKQYRVLFQLHHPNRERFEREGWPAEGADDGR